MGWTIWLSTLFLGVLTVKGHRFNNQRQDSNTHFPNIAGNILNGFKSTYDQITFPRDDFEPEDRFGSNKFYDDGPKHFGTTDFHEYRGGQNVVPNYNTAPHFFDLPANKVPKPNIDSAYGNTKHIEQDLDKQSINFNNMPLHNGYNVNVATVQGGNNAQNFKTESDYYNNEALKNLAVMNDAYEKLNIFPANQYFNDKLQANVYTKNVNGASDNNAKTQNKNIDTIINIVPKESVLQNNRQQQNDNSVAQINNASSFTSDNRQSIRSKDDIIFPDQLGIIQSLNIDLQKKLKAVGIIRSPNVVSINLFLKSDDKNDGRGILPYGLNPSDMKVLSNNNGHLSSTLMDNKAGERLTNTKTNMFEQVHKNSNSSSVKNYNHMNVNHKNDENDSSSIYFPGISDNNSARNQHTVGQYDTTNSDDNYRPGVPLINLSEINLPSNTKVNQYGFPVGEGLASSTPVDNETGQYFGNSHADMLKQAQKDSYSGSLINKQTNDNLKNVESIPGSAHILGISENIGAGHEYVFDHLNMMNSGQVYVPHVSRGDKNTKINTPGNYDRNGAGNDYIYDHLETTKSGHVYKPGVSEVNKVLSKERTEAKKPDQIVVDDNPKLINYRHRTIPYYFEGRTPGYIKTSSNTKSNQRGSYVDEEQASSLSADTKTGQSFENTNPDMFEQVYKGKNLGPTQDSQTNVSDREDENNSRFKYLPGISNNNTGNEYVSGHLDTNNFGNIYVPGVSGFDNVNVLSNKAKANQHGSYEGEGQVSSSSADIKAGQNLDRLNKGSQISKNMSGSTYIPGISDTNGAGIEIISGHLDSTNSGQIYVPGVSKVENNNGSSKTKANQHGSYVVEGQVSSTPADSKAGQSFKNTKTNLFEQGQKNSNFGLNKDSQTNVSHTEDENNSGFKYIPVISDKHGTGNKFISGHLDTTNSANIYVPGGTVFDNVNVSNSTQVNEHGSYVGKEQVSSKPVDTKAGLSFGNTKTNIFEQDQKNSKVGSNKNSLINENNSSSTYIPGISDSNAPGNDNVFGQLDRTNSGHIYIPGVSSNKESLVKESNSIPTYIPGISDNNGAGIEIVSGHLFSTNSEQIYVPGVSKVENNDGSSKTKANQHGSYVVEGQVSSTPADTKAGQSFKNTKTNLFEQGQKNSNFGLNKDSQTNVSHTEDENNSGFKYIPVISDKHGTGNKFVSGHLDTTISANIYVPGSTVFDNVNVPNSTQVNEHGFYVGKEQVSSKPVDTKAGLSFGNTKTNIFEQGQKNSKVGSNKNSLINENNSSSTYIPGISDSNAPGNDYVFGQLDRTNSGHIYIPGVSSNKDSLVKESNSVSTYIPGISDNNGAGIEIVSGHLNSTNSEQIYVPGVSKVENNDGSSKTKANQHGSYVVEGQVSSKPVDTKAGLSFGNTKTNIFEQGQKNSNVGSNKNSLINENNSSSTYIPGISDSNVPGNDYVFGQLDRTNSGHIYIPGVSGVDTVSRDINSNQHGSSLSKGQLSHTSLDTKAGQNFENTKTNVFDEGHKNSYSPSNKDSLIKENNSVSTYIPGISDNNGADIEIVSGHLDSPNSGQVYVPGVSKVENNDGSSKTKANQHGSYVVEGQVSSTPADTKAGQSFKNTKTNLFEQGQKNSNFELNKDSQTNVSHREDENNSGFKYIPVISDKHGTGNKFVSGHLDTTNSANIYVPGGTVFDNVNVPNSTQVNEHGSYVGKEQVSSKPVDTKADLSFGNTKTNIFEQGQKNSKVGSNKNSLINENNSSSTYNSGHIYIPSVSGVDNVSRDTNSNQHGSSLSEGQVSHISLDTKAGQNFVNTKTNVFDEGHKNSYFPSNKDSLVKENNSVSTYIPGISDNNGAGIEIISGHVDSTNSGQIDVPDVSKVENNDGSSKTKANQHGSYVDEGQVPSTSAYDNTDQSFENIKTNIMQHELKNTKTNIFEQGPKNSNFESNKDSQFHGEDENNSGFKYIPGISDNNGAINEYVSGHLDTTNAGQVYVSGVSVVDNSVGAGNTKGNRYGSYLEEGRVSSTPEDTKAGQSFENTKTNTFEQGQKNSNFGSNKDIQQKESNSISTYISDNNGAGNGFLDTTNSDQVYVTGVTGVNKVLSTENLDQIVNENSKISSDTNRKLHHSSGGHDLIDNDVVSNTKSNSFGNRDDQENKFGQDFKSKKNTSEQVYKDKSSGNINTAQVNGYSQNGASNSGLAYFLGDSNNRGVGPGHAVGHLDTTNSGNFYVPGATGADDFEALKSGHLYTNDNTKASSSVGFNPYTSQVFENSGNNLGRVYLSNTNGNPNAVYVPRNFGATNSNSAYLTGYTGAPNTAQVYTPSYLGVNYPRQVYIPGTIGILSSAPAYTADTAANIAKPIYVPTSGDNNLGQFYIPNVPIAGGQVPNGGYYKGPQMNNGPYVSDNRQTPQWLMQSNKDH